MKKLTRQALVLFYAIVIVIVLAVAFIFLSPREEKKKPTQEDKYSVVVVAENQQLASTYVDAISQEKSSSEYKEYRITLEEGTKIGDYLLSSQQIFSKYIQAIGPDGEKEMMSGSKHLITHYAYSMLLVGDIIEKTNLNTKEKTYEIVNARITYDQIPISLLSEDDSVVLVNKNKTQEKIMNLQEFVNSLKSVEKRNDVISW